MEFRVDDKMVHPEHGPSVLPAYFRPGLQGVGQLDYILVIPHLHTEGHEAGDEIDLSGCGGSCVHLNS